MIFKKDIIQDGHETLVTVADAVEMPISDNDHKTLLDMMKYLFASQDSQQAEALGIRPAVGIAAPQINIRKRMFGVLTRDENGKTHNLAVVNPVITKKSEEMIYLGTGEGCLSVDPEISGLVARHSWIEVSSYLLDFKTNKLVKKKYRLKGFVGIVFQHEFDHLDGIMFTTKTMNEQDIPNNYRKID